MPRKQRLSARYRSGGLRQKAGVQDPKMLKKKELLAKARDRAERRATQATSEPAAPPCDVQAQLNDHCRNDNICSRELSTQQKHVNKRKKMRHSRDARRASTSFDANIDAVSAAVLPAGLGASAQTRCAPWAKDGRSESATMQAAERAIRQLLVILRKRLAKGRADQAAAMLGGLLRAPDIRPLLTAAGCMLTEDSTLDTHIVNQMAEIVGPLSRGKGAKSYQERRALDLVGLLVSEPVVRRSKRLRPVAEDDEDSSDHAPPMSQPWPAGKPPELTNIPYSRLSARLGMAERTGHRLLSKQGARRRTWSDLEAHQKEAYLIDMRKRKGGRGVSDDVKAQVTLFLADHPNVRPSPYSQDTLLVRGEDGQKNVRVPRLLLEISIARLYSQFKEQHGEIIGERKFYDLLPANLRRMNGRRESCGCTEHIRMNLLQRTLNQWRQVQKAKLGPAYKPPEHSHVSFAVAECVCPDAAQGFAPAACWMRRGCGCAGVRKLRAKLPRQELQKGARAPTITFRTYEYRVEISPRYGTKKRHLQLVKRTMTIGDFIDEIYLPTLEKFVYHHELTRLLERMRQQRKAVVPGNVLDERDFAEKLAACFEEAIQSEHWQTTSMTIETSIVESYARDVVDAYLRKGRAPEEGELRDIQRFALSSYERQDAAVVYRNMDKQIAKLMDDGRLKVRHVLKQGTDGCAGQYWCSKAAFLTSKLAAARRVTIDRFRSSPGHGKRKVDGAHAVLKSFLREVMAMLDDDERKPTIGAETHEEGCKRDFAEACHTCAVEHLSTCRDASGMRKKKLTHARTESREFDLYKPDDVEFKSLKMKPVDPSTKEERRMKLPHRGWKSYHNLRCDHQLPEGEVMLRRWPCGCKPCEDQLSESELEKRYAPSLGCVMRPVFGELNDWKKVSLVKQAQGGAADAVGDEDDDDGDDLEDDESDEGEVEHEHDDELEAGEWALAEYTDRLADDVERGDVIAIEAPGDSAANGYYLLEAEGQAYELASDEYSGDEAWGVLEAGTRVVDAFWYNLVGRTGSAPHYYTASSPKVRVKVPTHLLLLSPVDVSKAVRRHGAGSSNANAAAARDGVVVERDVVDDILQEIAVRARLEEE